MLWYLLVPISVQITDHTRTPLSFRETPVSPASPLYTDGKRFPPLWATASLCSVIQVTNSNFLYFLHLLGFFSAFWLFEVLPSPNCHSPSWSSVHGAGKSGIPWGLQDCTGGKACRLYWWCDREKGSSFSRNTFYVNASMRDRFNRFLREPFEVFVHIVEKKEKQMEHFLFFSNFQHFYSLLHQF